MYAHRLLAVGGRSLWNLEHSPDPAWETEGSGKGLGMWGGGPRRPRTGGAGRGRKERRESLWLIQSPGYGPF